MLIYNFFINRAYVSIMPRPKHFGKTLNLSMIENIFDIQKHDSIIKLVIVFTGKVPYIKKLTGK